MKSTENKAKDGGPSGARSRDLRIERPCTNAMEPGKTEAGPAPLQKRELPVNRGDTVRYALGKFSSHGLVLWSGWEGSYPMVLVRWLSNDALQLILAEKLQLVDATKAGGAK